MHIYSCYFFDFSTRLGVMTTFLFFSDLIIFKIQKFWNKKIKKTLGAQKINFKSTFTLAIFFDFSTCLGVLAAFLFYEI